MASQPRAVFREEGIIVDDAINQYHAPDRYPGPHVFPKHLQKKVRKYIADPFTSRVDPASIQAKKIFKFGRGTYTVQIDQVRDGAVWDVKYSRRGEESLLDYSLPQLVISAYAFGLRIGGIINVRNYGTSRPVYHHVAESNLSVTELMCLVHNILELSL